MMGPESRRPSPPEGELQNDVEALLCMGLNGEDFFMPGHPMEERLRWAIPMAALMRIKPPHPQTVKKGSRVCSGSDPTCPCQDGDACHYEGPDAWPIPDARVPS